MSNARAAFNDANKLPYEITIPIGDWSDDGHGKFREISFMSSHAVENLRAAYLRSVLDTGLSFDSEHGTIQIATEYQEPGLSASAQRKLEGLGFDLGTISDREALQPDDLVNMILWFIKRSLPEFEYQVKDKTYLNGFWNEGLNVQF